MTWSVDTAAQNENMNYVQAFTESHIESALARSLLQASMFRLSPEGIPPDPRGGWVYVVPQYGVGRYRLDFALFVITYDEDIVMIDLECDGKQFHSTPQQIEKDDERNVTLVSEGWIVLRYPGGAIHHEADACADEVQTFIECILAGCPTEELVRGKCFGWDNWHTLQRSAA